MSVDELSDSVFQTPDSIVVRSTVNTHPELDTERQEGPDIGASPNLGPSTRSGKKRKHVAPVKSSGKKKTKMIRSPTAGGSDTNSPTRRASTSSVPPGQPAQGPPGMNDLAALLTRGLAEIKTEMGGMESRLGEKITTVEKTVKTNVQNIADLTSTVSATAKELSALKARVESSEEDLDRRVAHAVRGFLERENTEQSFLQISTDQSVSAGCRARNPQQLASYEKCRRSLRLWPIRGPNLEEDVHKFLTDLLQFSTDFVANDLGRVRVERIVEPRSKIKYEALVEFGSAAIRDSVKGSGYRLEGKQAGIRIEVPNYLKSDFHVLQSISYKMKIAHPGMKRSIKYDDDTNGMFLDVQIPGLEWRRIRPDQARAARLSDPSLNTGPLELSGEMIAGTISKGPGPRLPLTGANTTPLS